jgi:hypothetical protein
MGIIPNLKLSLKEFFEYDLKDVLIQVACCETLVLTLGYVFG